MKPMLAAKADLATLAYPMLLSPKLDGVRCLIIDGVACGRSLKPIPNKSVQLLFGHPEFNGLDGELIVDSPVAKDVFQKTQSGVMSIEGQPQVKFYVFDDFSHEAGFAKRLDVAFKRTSRHTHFVQVQHDKVNREDAISTWEASYLGAGYEGVMLRDPAGAYKHGRSTTKEAGLLKVKRFEDSEAVVVGYTQLMTNTNEAKRNALGHLERSSHKAGMVPAGTLGSLVVIDVKTRVEFDIGTGFTAEQRAALWKDHENLLNKVVKYKFQPVGVKDKPRFPVFLGFRSKVDM